MVSSRDIRGPGRPFPQDGASDPGEGLCPSRPCHEACLAWGQGAPGPGFSGELGRRGRALRAGSGHCARSGARCRHLQSGARGLGSPHLRRAWRTQAAHNQLLRSPRAHASPAVPEGPGPMSPACLSGPLRPVLASSPVWRVVLSPPVSVLGSACPPVCQADAPRGRNGASLAPFTLMTLSLLGANQALSWVLAAASLGSCLTPSCPAAARVTCGSCGGAPAPRPPACGRAAVLAPSAWGRSQWFAVHRVLCTGYRHPSWATGPRLSPGSPLLLLAHVLPSTCHLDTVPDHVSSFPRSVRELLAAPVFAARGTVAGMCP